MTKQRHFVFSFLSVSLLILFARSLLFVFSGINSSIPSHPILSSILLSAENELNGKRARGAGGEWGLDGGREYLGGGGLRGEGRREMGRWGLGIREMRRWGDEDWGDEE